MTSLHSCILIVEDSADDAFLMERAFQRAGVDHLVHVSRDGDQAIRYLAGEGEFADRERWPLPGLALVDLRMPCGSGLDVLAYVRSRQGLRRLPVIVLTAGGNPGDIDRAYDMGANSCLLKPLGFEALQSMVAALADWWLRHNEPGDLVASEPLHVSFV